MSTTLQTRKRVKPERKIRLVRPITDGVGALLITVGGEHHPYLVTPIASDFGAAFLLTKQELVPVDTTARNRGEALAHHPHRSNPCETFRRSSTPSAAWPP